jgi:MATE family multidrug resistance protein
MSLCVGVGLSSVLGFGLAGFPKMGTAGVAIGFVFEAYLTAALFGLYIACHSEMRNFHFFNLSSKVKWSYEQLQEILAKAKSISFAVGTEMALSLTLGIVSGLIGPSEQSAMNFINQFMFFNFIAVSAFGQSCSQELARKVGVGDYVSASAIAKYGLLTSLIYTVPIPLFFAIKPDYLMFATPDQHHIENMLQYLAPIMATGIIIDSLRYNILQQLRSVNDLVGSSLVSTGGLSVGMLIGAILGLTTKSGIYGLAAGYTGGVVLAGSGLLYRWKSRIQPEMIKQVVEDETKAVSVATSVVTFFHKFKPKSAQPDSQSLLEKGSQSSYGATKQNIN